MGKGSKRRPSAVDADKVRDNWDRVFGRKPAAESAVPADAKERLEKLEDERQALRKSRGFAE